MSQPFTPISQLSPSHGHVLILGASATIETPLRAAVGYRGATGTILTLDGERFDAGGTPAIGFMPLPWTEAQAEALIVSRETVPAPAPRISRAIAMDATAMRIEARKILEDVEDQVEARTAMGQLVILLGLRQDDFRMPTDAGNDLHELRSLAGDWLASQLSSFNAIEVARRLIDGSSLAEDPD